MHHVSIRTANIHRAIAFYELLGFTVSDRFTTGYTLACWMAGILGRIELIEIPEPKTTADAFHDQHYVGYYHISFDLTNITSDLTAWLADLQTKWQSIMATNPQYNQPCQILLAPTQQMIGNRVYEVAFIADMDNLPLEFIRLLATIPAEN